MMWTSLGLVFWILAAPGHGREASELRQPRVNPYMAPALYPGQPVPDLPELPEITRRDTFLRVVDKWPFGSPFDVLYDAEEHRAYLSAGAGVFEIDLSVPEHPVIVSDRIRVGQYIVEIQRADSLMFFACGKAGVYLWYVTPDTAYELGHWTAHQNAQRIVYHAPYLFVADRDSGLRILDVSDPTQPVEVGFWNLPSQNHQIRSVQAASHYAYASFSNGMLYVLDVSQPENPQPVDSLDFGLSWGMDYANGKLYVGASRRLGVFSLEDPAHPELLGVDTLDRPIVDVKVVGDTLALLAHWQYGVSLVDVRDPLNIHPLDAQTFEDVRPRPQVDRIDGDGSVILAPLYTSYDLRIGRIQGGQITMVSRVRTPQYLRGIILRPPYLFLRDFSGALWILRFEGDQVHLASMYEFGPDQGCWGMAMEDPYLYLALRMGDVAVLDMSTPTQPRLVNDYSNFPAGSDEMPGDLAVQDHILYLADQPRLFMYRVNDPVKPVFLWSLRPEGHHDKVSVWNHILYISLIEPQLRVIDARDPLRPVALPLIPLGAPFTGRVLRQGSLLFAPASDGLRIYQTYDDPGQLTFLGMVSTPEDLLAVDVNADGTLAIGGGYPFVVAVDVSNPQSPQILDLVPMLNSARAIKIYGNRVFVACNDAGLWVLAYP